MGGKRLWISAFSSQSCCSGNLKQPWQQHSYFWAFWLIDCYSRFWGTMPLKLLRNTLYSKNRYPDSYIRTHLILYGRILWAWNMSSSSQKVGDVRFEMNVKRAKFVSLCNSSSFFSSAPCSSVSLSWGPLSPEDPNWVASHQEGLVKELTNLVVTKILLAIDKGELQDLYHSQDPAERDSGERDHLDEDWLLHLVLLRSPKFGFPFCKLILKPRSLAWNLSSSVTSKQ